MPIATSTLGFPRIGKKRELKFIVEGYWKGKLSAAELEHRASDLRKKHLLLQKEAGIDHIAVGDAALYDHVLDLAQALGAFPNEVRNLGASLLDESFLLARGHVPDGTTARPLEMTKWFDTNYHYLVPEFAEDTQLTLRFNPYEQACREAAAAGIASRPVVLGPVSFLLLSKATDSQRRPIERLEELLPPYVQLLRELQEAGASSVQLDEPCLCLDPGEKEKAAYQRAYHFIADKIPELRPLLTPYFGSIADELDWIVQLPIAGLHLDLARAPGDLDRALELAPETLQLRLGVIDGRNVWRADLDDLLDWLEPLIARKPERFELSPSCSLLHCPVDLKSETELDPEVKPWLSFACQKLEELRILARALSEGRGAIARELEQSRAAASSRKTNPRVKNAEVRKRQNTLGDQHFVREKTYPERAPVQRQRLSLPLLPTTTIGSFPQTPEIRKKRAAFRSGELAATHYEVFVDQTIEEVIRCQERLDLDVLVHGEPERNDMVEYFGERLEGFLHTRFGWVQSYGSRCVKPPIIFGDVQRKGPMTVREARHAQSLTSRPVKGMLTGPVTLLKWSFVRNDQPLGKTAEQIALCIRDEVADLEKAGIAIVQVDEPALREGLPLSAKGRPEYLKWSVDAFRLATSGAAAETQVHTHMCYSEFGDILPSIVKLDADVLSIESARSRMELLQDFADVGYPNEIGPGVYDIHSPRIPTQEHMARLLELALQVIPKERLWVNPDCGLKTRNWNEVEPALHAMVAAAKLVRQRLESHNVPAKESSSRNR